MGFWKEFFSNMDEPAIIIQTKETIEIPDMELMAPRRKVKQIGAQKQKQLKCIEAEYKLLR